MSEAREELPFRPRLLLPGIVLAAALGLCASALPFADARQCYQGSVVAAVTALCAFCWLTGALPLAPASLLPLALLPLLGALPTRVVAPCYADPITWMFFGGFVLALAIERAQLHRRIALRTIALFGVRPRRLVLGFLVAAVAISMWINNTAVSLMLLPIGWATVSRVEAEGLLPQAAARRFGVALLLAIAWGASIGGIATPIGTAPNLIFFSVYQPLVAAGKAAPVSFLHWMLAFTPFALLLTAVTYGLLALWFRLPAGDDRAGRAVLDEARALPPMRQAEWSVLIVFVLVVVAWITRGEFTLGGGVAVPGTGWGRWPEAAFGLARDRDEFVLDGSIAILLMALLFVLPMQGLRGPRLMDWETARRMPLEILFLIGGGVAIASAFDKSGLSAAVGKAIAPLLGTVPPLVAVGAVALLLVALTEFTSNTAINSLMLPILASIGQAADLDPRLLMLTCTVAASCGFALPIGTPPNTVVFATGRIRIGQMVGPGLVLDLLSAALLTAWMAFWVVPILGIRR